MKSIIVALSLVLFSSMPQAGEAIPNPQEFDAEVTGCLAKLTSSAKCISSAVSKHVLPGYEKLVTVAQQADEMLGKWLGNDKVFAVHPIATRTTGDMYQKSTYIIEDTSGSLMLFTYSIVKRLGKWYVFSFNISSNSDVVEATLKGEK